MSYTDSLSYFLTVFILAIAPGPVVLMLIVRSASDDIKGAAGFGLGYAIGGVIIITAVCFGLSAWLTAVPEVFEYTKYIMMAYMLWVARDIWKGGVDLSQGDTDVQTSTRSPVLAGIATCFISPYIAIMLPLSLPEIMNVAVIEMPEFLIIALITFGSLALAAAIVVGFAAQLRRLARSGKGQLFMNRGLSALLVCGGGTMVFI
jgi:threonine/homoserine/homoserine lactone efflux protein